MFIGNRHTLYSPNPVHYDTNTSQQNSMGGMNIHTLKITKHVLNLLNELPLVLAKVYTHYVHQQYQHSQLLLMCQTQTHITHPSTITSFTDKHTNTLTLTPTTQALPPPKYWWKLPQVLFLSRQNFWHDKRPVLSQQNYACHNKHNFVMTKVL